MRTSNKAVYYSEGLILNFHIELYSFLLKLVSLFPLSWFPFPRKNHQWTKVTYYTDIILYLSVSYNNLHSRIYYSRAGYYCSVIEGFFFFSLNVVFISLCYLNKWLLYKIKFFRQKLYSFSSFFCGIKKVAFLDSIGFCFISSVHW